jgi:hypothetical protein
VARFGKGTPENVVQIEPIRIALQQTMQPKDHNDSETTDATPLQAKRAINNAIARINGDTAGESEYGAVLGEISRPQEADRTAQQTRPSPELQREHAERAFHASAEHLIRILNQYDLRSPVTVALDVTVVNPECWTGPETCERPDTTSKEESHSGKLRVATATVANSPVPATLGIIPLDSGANDEKRCYSEIAQELLYQVTRYVDVDTVLASRAFNSVDCITEFEERDIQYIVPARKSARVTAEINRLHDSGVTEATVEPGVTICGNSRQKASTAFVYIPAESGSETVEFTPFLSNLDAVINDPESLPGRFNQRWQAAQQARLFRKQVADKSAPADELSVPAFWVAATEANAYQLARMVLADTADNLKARKALSFTQFIAFVQHKRQFGSLHTKE